MTLSSIVTIAGAKGGVGKTTTSINLATALAGSDRQVAVVELDLAMANVVDFLSLPRDESDPTVHDVLSGDAEPLDAAYHFGDNVVAVPSGTSLDGYVDADLDRLPSALRAYASAYDIVILDTGAGLNRAVVEPMRLADGTVVVSTPRVASLRDADKTVQLSKRVDTPVYGLVLAQSGTGQSPGAERISEFLDVDLLGHVPDDEAVPASQDNGVPVVEATPNSPAGSTYQEIADHLLFELSVYTDPAQDEQSALDDSPREHSFIERAVDETSAPQAAEPVSAIYPDDSGSSNTKREDGSESDETTPATDEPSIPVDDSEFDGPVTDDGTAEETDELESDITGDDDSPENASGILDRLRSLV